jgi:mono/diheme cytochrome c family protein
MVLAASTQRTLGLAIVAVLVGGWLIYVLVANLRSGQAPGSEIETAPNRRPYFDDDQLEGPRLDRMLSLGLISLAFIAVFLPIYWLREPGRQKNAIVGFQQRATKRGAELFQSASAPVPPGHLSFGCADCHGNKGQGGSTNFTLTDPKNPTNVRIVQWQVPALDTVLLRFNEDPKVCGDPLQAGPLCEVTQIITYGRPGTPMPPWGVNGGGPMNDQQISDLVAFIRSIQIGSKQAKADDAKLGATDGHALFDAFCAFGPNLTNGAEDRQFPDAAKQVLFITIGSDYQKLYGVRGIGSGRMPGFGDMLSAAQIKAIVDYERSL